ncbi:nucleoside deaminase [Patescibacteria group bacterium]|nr:nucleoside deaminase [Patescibacteria group bacterium]MBU4452956.1 nucleoside deaminase [Patescibacteria group bacterium]MCG2687388.1 nucleoside deaminase [Candidatus Parcubacteria bacterium]
MDKKQNEKFMRLAIEEAMKSLEPLRCGVVIVKNGEVIAKTYNSQRESKNSSAHAEIKALGVAGQVVGNKNLNGCDIFCTCEPCLMCVSAITFAKIERLFFGISLSDVSPADKRININIDDFLKKSPYKFQIIKNFLEDECKVLI